MPKFPHLCTYQNCIGTSLQCDIVADFRIQTENLPRVGYLMLLMNVGASNQRHYLILL